MSGIIQRVTKPYRFISTTRFYAYLRKAVREAGGMRVNKKQGLVSTQFAERIFLAVTSVNGCRYCSYYHAKLALTSGMDRAEVKQVLSGEFGEVPDEELIALAYAQHYADTGGQPEPETVDTLLQTYGETRARVIQTHINMITVGNFYGTAFDGLQSRFRLRPISGSRFSDELGITVGILFMLPVLFIDLVLAAIMPKSGRKEEIIPSKQPFYC